MMNKRTMLVAVGCLLALFAWQFIVNKLYPPIPKKPRPAIVETVTTNGVPPQAVAEPEPKVEVAIKEATPAVEQPRPAEQRAVLKNEFVVVELTSWGGGIRSVELLKHKANGRGNEVLNGHGGTASLALANVAGADTNDVFTLEQPDGRTVVMRARTPAGLVVTKTFSLGTDYVISGEVRFDGDMALAGVTNLAVVVGTATPTHAREVPNYLVVDWQGASKFRNRTLPRVRDRMKAGHPHEQLLAGWVAVKSQYFAMVLTPTTNVTGVTYAPIHLSPGPPPVDGVMAIADVPVTVPAYGSGSCQFTLYAGPKEYDRLAKLGGHQEELMDFGTPMDLYTGIFGEALVWVLRFFYRLIPNYGVAIILVTVVLKVVFWPVQAKSIRSMKEMQKFQPLMQKIREKYKDDPQRMNQELMKLYKEHKINPLSGCLPMAVQLPVLIAFYRVLVSDIALRGAKFLWIKDLSQPDTIFSIGGIPVNPLPLVMVGSMIWQQKITPTTGDKQQARMMMIMPVMMLFFFYNVASGLVLYWTLQQILSMAQQWWSLRHAEPAPAPAQPLATGKTK